MKRDERAAKRRDKVLGKLYKKPEQTSVQLREPTPYLANMAKHGLVRKTGVRKGKGRPANLWDLTAKGKARLAEKSSV